MKQRLPWPSQRHHTKKEASVLHFLRKLRSRLLPRRPRRPRNQQAQLGRLTRLAAHMDALLIAGQVGPDTRKQLQAAREGLESRIRCMMAG